MNTQLTKPSNVTTAGILLVIGGIVSLVVTMGTAAIMIPITFCVWTPVSIYGFVASVLAIVKGAQLLGDVQPGAGVPIAAPVLLMLNLLNFDIVGAALGVVALVLVNDTSTKNWLTGQGPVLLAPGVGGPMTNVTPGAQQLVPAGEPQWGAPAPPAPAPPAPAPAAPPAPEAQWGTATPDSEAAADRAAAGADWSDWGATGAEAGPPPAAPDAALATTSPEMPAPALSSATPVETPAVATLPPALAPASGDEWGEWGMSDVSVDETPPEADPLRPEAWDLADDLKKPQ